MGWGRQSRIDQQNHHKKLLTLAGGEKSVQGESVTLKGRHTAKTTTTTSHSTPESHWLSHNEGENQREFEGDSNRMYFSAQNLDEMNNSIQRHWG